MGQDILTSGGWRTLKWDVVELVSVVDGRGMLTAFELERHVPFDIRRLFYLQQVPPGGVRGQHAHDADEFLVCVAGSVEIDVDDGHRKAHFRLDRPAKGLSLAPMVWVELTNFSADGVLLVLGSKPWNPADAIRHYSQFLDLVGPPQ